MFPWCILYFHHFPCTVFTIVWYNTVLYSYRVIGPYMRLQTFNPLDAGFDRNSHRKFHVGPPRLSESLSSNSRTTLLATLTPSTKGEEKTVSFLRDWYFTWMILDGIASVDDILGQQDRYTWYLYQSPSWMIWDNPSSSCNWDGDGDSPYCWRLKSLHQLI